MRLTGKQAHVLANIERVVPRPYKITTLGQRPRYDLDGWECTFQVTSLIVKQMVRRMPSGSVVRVAERAATFGGSWRPRPSPPQGLVTMAD